MAEKKNAILAPRREPLASFTGSKLAFGEKDQLSRFSLRLTEAFFPRLMSCKKHVRDLRNGIGFVLPFKTFFENHGRISNTWSMTWPSKFSFLRGQRVGIR